MMLSQQSGTPRRDRLPGLRTGQTVSNITKIITFKQQAGEWILPVSTWKMTDYSAKVIVSTDDGKTWSRVLLLDERKGISYPDGQQTKDGTIYIVYDYNRRTNQNILLTSFTEADILANDYDKRIIKVYNNRKIVSEGE